MEQIVENNVCNKNIFTEKAIWFGTYLGGPLTSGYLFAENFKVFGEPEKARKAWIYSIVATVILFTTLYLIPAQVISKIPNVLIPVTYTVIARYIFQRNQQSKTTDYIKTGGKAFSLWRTFAISLIGAAITLTPIFAVSYLSERAEEESTVSTTHGTLNHVINYNRDNISAAEVDQIAAGLTKIEFFDEKDVKYTYVKKVDNTYEISISCDSSIQQTSFSFTPLINWRNDMQALFPKNKIVFILVVDSLDHVIKRLD